MKDSSNSSKKTNWKGIFTVISTLFMHLIFGSCFSWASINTYYTSYLRLHDSPNMKLEDGYFFLSLNIFLGNIFGILGAYLEEKKGARTNVVVSVIFYTIGNLIICNTTKLLFIYFAQASFGFSLGISFTPALKNSWQYFPDKKGLVGGIVLLGFGLSSLIFTSIADCVINPDYAKPGADKYFSIDIAERVPTYLLFFSIITFGMGIFAIFATTTYEKESESTKENKSTPSSNTDDDSPITNDELKQVYTSRTVYLLLFSTFCNAIHPYTVNSTFRAFGQRKEINEQLLGYLAKMFSFLNGSTRLIYGMLLDKYGFKGPYLGVIIFELFISSFLYFTGGNPIVYFIMVCGSACIQAGNFALTIPAYPRFFGISKSSQIFSIANSILGTSSLVTPIITKLVIHENVEDYKLLYWIGTGFSLVGLILVILLKEEKFQYKHDIKEEELANIKEEN